jgi:hypothetical protein
MICAVSGAGGFVGRALVRAIRARGDEARPLPRIPYTPTGYDWSPLDGADCVFHLAGEPVSQRWSPEVKRRIRDSRVLGSRSLVAALSKLQRPPAALVSASAVGFYGDRAGESLDESSSPGDGFLPAVCQEWEHECAQAGQLGLRAVSLRIGIVLGPGGGALAKMLPPFQLGVGGVLGDGRQWMPWIQLHDLVEMFLWSAGHPTLSGPVNAVAPEPVTNAAFTRALASVLHRPAFMPVPRFALRLLYGEMAEVLLGSQRVFPRLAVTHGFQYRYPDLQPALQASL